MPKTVLSQPLVDGPLALGDHFDLATPNFGLRVWKHRRTYFVRVREGEAGRRVRVTLGHARSTSRPAGLSLKEARALAAGKISQHDEGRIIQPPIPLGVDTVALSQLDADTITIGQLVDLFLAEHAGAWSPPHKRNSEFYAGRIVKPTFGPQLARTLTRRQVKTLEQSYAKRAPVSANRLHAFLSKLCRWAVREEWLETNPVAQLSKQTVEESRARELTPAELRRFWRALAVVTANPEASPRDRAVADLWRLRLLTAQRETPLRCLEWSWIKFDEKLIDVPAAAMKGMKGKRLPHVVPLGPTALAILEARRLAASPLDLFVFGSRVGTTAAPGKTRGTPIALPDFQGKDLRRTASTLMAEHGISDFVVGRVLAHKVQSVTGIYNRYQYLAEKRVALETLDRVLTTILEPAKTQSPTPLLPFAAGA